jgi:hypothetical protein
MTVYVAGAAGGYGLFDNGNKFKRGRKEGATVSKGGTGGTIR